MVLKLTYTLHYVVARLMKLMAYLRGFALRREHPDIQGNHNRFRLLLRLHYSQTLIDLCCTGQTTVLWMRLANAQSSGICFIFMHMLIDN